MSYEGWANRSTWNVVLHVDNDYGLYTLKERVARDGGNYSTLVEALKAYGVERTGDGIAYDPQCSEALCVRELDEWMQESREEQAR